MLFNFWYFRKYHSCTDVLKINPIRSCYPWFCGTIRITLARNFTLAWVAGFISAGITSVSFYSPFVLICPTLAVRGHTDNALCGTLNGPSPRDLTCADRPLSSTVIGRNCLPCRRYEQLFQSGYDACAFVSENKKKIDRKFQCKTCCASCAERSITALRSVLAFHVASRRVLRRFA